MKIDSWLEEKDPISAPITVMAAMSTWPLLGSEDPPGKEILWMSTEGKTDLHLQLIRHQRIQCKPLIISFLNSAACRVTRPLHPAGAFAALLSAEAELRRMEESVGWQAREREKSFLQQLPKSSPDHLLQISHWLLSVLLPLSWESHDSSKPFHFPISLLFPN